MEGGLDLQNRVLGKPSTRDEALRWACRSGCIPGIDAAIRNGASVSIVTVAVAKADKQVAVIDSDAESPPSDHATVKALTLQLAAKAGQVDAFEYLISHGARLDCPGTSLESVRSLVGLVTRGPNAPALLSLLLTSREGASARFASQLSQDLRDEALLAVLQACAGPWPRKTQHASMEEYILYLRVLIDAGASPNCFRGHARLHRDDLHPCTISALSAAVAVRSLALVQLLLDRGAGPDGPSDLQSPPIALRPLHIPLCAVCDSLATSKPTDALLQDLHTDKDIVRLLLDRGADINIAVPLKQDSWFITFTTPLLVFLKAVNDWDEVALSSLRFLLDRGATPVGPPIPRSETWHGEDRAIRCHELLRGGRFRFGKQINIIEYLLDRWTVQSLASCPNLAVALELLISHPDYYEDGDGAVETAKTLARYDYTSEGAKEQDHVVEAWLSIVHSVASTLSQTDLNEFLHVYITRKATCPEKQRWPPTGSHRSSNHVFGDLARSTVQALLSAGADINYRRAGTVLDNDSDCPTILHAISLWLAGRDADEESSMFGWSPYCRGIRRTPQRTEFIRFLIQECGAKTDVRYQGRTASMIIQQLSRAELDEGLSQPIFDPFTCLNPSR